jgi:hypothetical protein
MGMSPGQSNYQVCVGCSFANGQHCAAAPGNESRLIVLAARGACPKGLHVAVAVIPKVATNSPVATAAAPPTPPVARPPAAVPRSEWPVAVQALARLARDGDRGIGDIAHRVAAASGAEGLARLFTSLTGRACGCSDRQARLNELYPL